MPRNTLPVMPTGRGLLSKVITLLIVLALLMVVIKYPGDAAHWVSATAGFAGRAIGGAVTFLRTLFG